LVLPPVCLLVPTYKEKPWITARVFGAIALEARTLNQPITLVTVSSGPEEDAAIVAALRLGDPDLSSVRIVHAKDPGDGKRKALADGLRAIAQLDLPKDTIIALMDGDSELTPGTLRKCLPFFKMFPKLGALTTDEIPDVMGSYVFSEWFHLRFAQRHYQMCSISLSKKILCLTGRFALYRAEPALNPDFANQLETDTLNDWLWGKFKFLSGDDKTTWYWMLRWTNYDLLYIPDVIVYSIESVSGSVPNRMYQNMRRWFGNMLRNGNRALALGPGKLTWFVTLCLLDQRCSMWTSLLSPCLLLLMLLRQEWVGAGILICWLLFSRSLTLSLIFWGRVSHLKPIHLPILLLSQWSSAVIKIWTQMNLAQQRWFNRGDRKLSVGGNPWVQLLTKKTSQTLLLSQAFTFGIVLVSLLGLLNPIRDLPEFWQSFQLTPQQPIETLAAIDYGVIPDDDQDDSKPLQALINQLPAQGMVQINLPLGELELRQPLKISRNHTILAGQGIDRTILTSRFATAAGAKSILVIQPAGNAAALQNVHLKGFTLRPDRTEQRSESATTLDGIFLKDVTQASLTNLYLERGGQRGVVLQSTQDVVMEYMTVEVATEEQKIVMIDAQNTQVQGEVLSQTPSRLTDRS
jgi:mannuronan synthase